MPNFTGETVDLAIQKGLSTLQITKENAKIDVIQEAKKGFLGFGKQDAVVAIETIELMEVVVDEEVKKEVIEEVGYTDIKSIKKISSLASCDAYRLTKNKNQKRWVKNMKC